MKEKKCLIPVPACPFQRVKIKKKNRIPNQVRFWIMAG
jgi:hypothetical protein